MLRRVISRSSGALGNMRRGQPSPARSTVQQSIALATVAAPHFAEGTPLEVEITVEAVRHRVPATVVKTPFFNPPRKTATPAF